MRPTPTLINMYTLIISPEDQRQYSGNTNDPRKKSKPVIVIVESKTGRNELFLDTSSAEILTQGEFISRIEDGKYPGYTVKEINGVPTPVSNPDGRRTNNLS